MRCAFAVLMFLAVTAPAQAQHKRDTVRFGNWTLGGNSYSGGTCSHPVNVMPDEVYVAQEGDTLIAVAAHMRATCTDNMDVALTCYRMLAHQTHRIPDTLLFADTFLNVDNAVADTYTVTCRVGMVPGRRYGVGVVNVDGCGIGVQYTYYSSAGDTLQWDGCPAVEWDSVYTSASYGILLCWGVVEVNAPPRVKRKFP